MSGFIDFHSHILPGIDDGSKNLEESLALLQMEAAQGVTHVVATPHFYPQHDHPDRFFRRRDNAENLLREAMHDYEGLPNLSVGAEVYYFHGMSDSSVISELTSGSGKCILIEMPQTNWTETMYRELEKIYEKRGIIPILAHVDRYINPLQPRKIFHRLAELPVLIQVNEDFFLNKFTSSLALSLLKKDYIHLLGSDCHNLQSRKPHLDSVLKLIQKRLGPDAISRLFSYGQDFLDNM